MLRIEGHALFSALNKLSAMDSIAKKDAPWVYKNEEQIATVNNALAELVVQLKKLDLRLSIKKAESMKIHIPLAQKYDADVVARSISDDLEELRERIQQELEERALYYVDAKEAELINKGATAFGRDVADKFPNAIEDLDEAAQCLGLSRNTACVFHLMRAMEVALHAIGKHLDVKISDNYDTPLSWGPIVENIGHKVESMPKGDEKTKWASIVTLLYSVKDGWRNPTMHPKQTYTNEEAHAVFGAVKTFMNSLAQEM